MIIDPELGMSRVYSENIKLIWMGVHELPDSVSKERERGSECVCIEEHFSRERFCSFNQIL